MQAAVVALVAHVTARRELGVSSSGMSLQCFKKLLVQAANLLGAIQVLRDTGAERLLDTIFAPYMVSRQLATTCIVSHSQVAQLPPSSSSCQPCLVSARTQSQEATENRAACFPQRDSDLYCTAFELWQKVGAPLPCSCSDALPSAVFSAVGIHMLSSLCPCRPGGSLPAQTRC